MTAVISSLILVASIGYFLTFLLYVFKIKKGRTMVFYLSFLIHTIYQINEGNLPGIFMSLKIFENPAFMPWSGAFFVLLFKIQKKHDEAWDAALLVPAVFALAAFLTPKSMTYFGPNKLTFWADLFFLFEFWSQACFLMGGILAGLFLAGKSESESFHSCVIWGFIAHTLSHVAGSIWCFLGWAATFQWVYVHIRSAAIWIYFANYIHLRFIAKWDDRKRAVFTIIGACLVLLFRLLAL